MHENRTDLATAAFSRARSTIGCWRVSRSDNAVRLMLIHNGVALAAIYSQAGRLDDAVVELSQATEGAERLIAFQPDNTDYQAHACSP